MYIELTVMTHALVRCASNPALSGARVVMYISDATVSSCTFSASRLSVAIV